MIHLQVKCSGTNTPHVCIHMAKKRFSASSLPIPNSWGHICLKYHLQLRCKGNISVSGPKFVSPDALLQTHNDKLDMQPVKGWEISAKSQIQTLD